jgi:hypothetical protein
MAARALELLDDRCNRQPWWNRDCDMHVIAYHAYGVELEALLINNRCDALANN